MEAGARRTFLVESFVPQLDEATALLLSARLRTAVAELRTEGMALEWLRSLALLDEETYVYVLAASDASSVARANRRAGMSHAHIVEAFAIDPFH